MARLKERYLKEWKEELKKELKLKNTMQIPRLEKIVLNTGIGEASKDKKFLERAAQEISTISGQKPIVRHAKKSIASFKIREGMSIGLKVTLRGKRMYEFLDRIVSIVLPRIKDFRGLTRKKFDGSGNFTFALTDQLVFPEIKFDQVKENRGMSITLVTSATDNKSAELLLKKFGLPIV
jgi:large subunit ribosomal protein L5